MAVDSTYNDVKNYRLEGGARWVVGGVLEIANGGTLVIDQGGLLLQGTNGTPSPGAAVAGQYTVLASDVTATHTNIPTTLAALTALSLTILRSGRIATSDAAPAFVGGNLQVSSGLSYVLTAGDVINYIAVGS